MAVIRIISATFRECSLGMDCHGGGNTLPQTDGEIILVGNHNVGKSVLFGWLTGKYVTVANYPGTTVEVARGIAQYDGHRVVVDTPGVNSLQPISDDERVTRDVLFEGSPSVVVQVADAKNLRRALLITSQVADLQVPLVLALKRHIVVDSEGLSARVGRLSFRLRQPSGMDWTRCPARCRHPGKSSPWFILTPRSNGWSRKWKNVCARWRRIRAAPR